jgi:P27 family predicted phage terminase small subunit
MGLKGKLRQPGSVRAEREGGTFIDAPEHIDAPKFLSKKAKAQFKKLVAELIGAGVPVKQLDCNAIAITAHTVVSCGEWLEREALAESLADKLKCSKEITRYARDLQKWLDMIGATPAARLRLGLKREQPKTSQLATLLAAKNEGTT